MLLPGFSTGPPRSPCCASRALLSCSTFNTPPQAKPYVSVNHFDADAVLSMWTYINRHAALQHSAGEANGGCCKCSGGGVETAVLLLLRLQAGGAGVHHEDTTRAGHTNPACSRLQGFSCHPAPLRHAVQYCATLHALATCGRLDWVTARRRCRRGSGTAWRARSRCGLL